MTALAVDALAEVRAAGGDVKFIGPERLKVVAPEPLPDRLVDKLRKAKPELLALLSNTSPPTTQIWDETEEERAAIIEYDGGAPRAWAEALALLDRSKPPGGVSPERWTRFKDDCGHFLDRGWAAQAVPLGWGPLELFGCDRKRPCYVPHRGLLWEVNGGKIVALDCDRAIIEIARGDRRAYKRQPLEVGRIVLAWELAGNST